MTPLAISVARVRVIRAIGNTLEIPAVDGLRTMDLIESNLPGL